MKRKTYLAHSFGASGPWSALLLLALWQGNTSWWGSHGGADLLTYDGDTKEGENGRDLDLTIPLKGTPPMTYNLPIGSTT
jgi:hypothetical protein